MIALLYTKNTTTLYTIVSVVFSIISVIVIIIILFIFYFFLMKCCCLHRNVLHEIYFSFVYMFCAQKCHCNILEKQLVENGLTHSPGTS